MHIANGIMWGLAANSALASIRMAAMGATAGQNDTPPTWWSMSFLAPFASS